MVVIWFGLKKPLKHMYLLFLGIFESGPDQSPYWSAFN
ncbi:rCG30382 [Rattus norvegicus]|uniref:RCG30382 n=1 Tax=Rattus norvegicus TaxID=10116 RepID=A6JFD7_RAT|nr:rCG30382 [Rattus norvegicus]